MSNDNVFLGGHSLGTTFAMRYAATDFDFTGGGPAEPGYAKLRGLVLLEGDAFADALIAIAGEARADPELLHAAPHSAPVRRLDEVKAAKDLVLCYAPGCGG